MILSFEFQLKIFFLALIIGFFVGFFYDIIRIFRNFVLHIKILIHIEDIIYWIFMSLIIFLIALYENNGEIRMFFLAGIFLGMGIYFYSFSKIFLKIANKILFVIKKCIIFIFECILTPFKLILKLLYSIFSPIFNVLKKIFIKNFLKIKKVLQKNKKCVKIYNKVNYIKNKFLIGFLKNLKKEGNFNENDGKEE